MNEVDSFEHICNVIQDIVYKITNNKDLNVKKWNCERVIELYKYVYEKMLNENANV